MVDIAKYFREITLGLYSLAVGMGITFRNMFLSPVTVQYPHASLKMYPRFRGHIELIRDGETGQPNCVVCLMCQKNCPSRCIAVEGEKPEGGKRKVPTRFILDFTTCSLCGICVENCKFAAIRHSKAYNLASTQKSDYIMDLLNPKITKEASCN
jgi:NADH-quinone oxidoreductase subunit I